MSSLLKRKYVSDIGKFLTDFDELNPEKSASQQKEIAKHARIARLRDAAPAPAPENNLPKIWKGF